MLFNKPLIKDAITIKAMVGATNTANIKGNTIVFTFTPTNKVSSVVFGRELSKTLLKYKGRNININVSSFIKAYKPECAISFAVAILTRLDAFIEKSWNLKSKVATFESNVIFDKKDAETIKVAASIVKYIHLARQYQIMPTNYLGINSYINEITKQVKKIGNKHLRVKVLTLKDLKKNNMGLIQAVNAGSDEDAAMVILEYFNSNKSNTLALVGKGIMNDTGGYELKPSKFLKEMNQDMTGSASVFATVAALAETNAKVNVVGLLPLAKNLINEHAMLVNDVYRACNGRSVEILSQDSEGRLVMADAIAYANKHYHVTTIATIATLTGLSELAFGDYLTPFWATKAKTANLISKAGDLACDGLISLPLFPDYFDMVNKSSQVADCANSCSERNASNGTAAAFLKEFSKCDDFVHFDVAGSNMFKKHPISPLSMVMFLLAKQIFGDK